MAAAVTIVPTGDVVAITTTASAAAVCTSTMQAVGGRLNYIRGFTVTVGLATSAVTTTFTLSGLAVANLVYEVAESTTAGAQLNVQFPFPIPASAKNTAIVGTLAAIANGGVPSVALYGDLV